MKKQLLRKVHWKYLMLFIVCLLSMNNVYASYYDFSADYNGATIYYDIQESNVVVVAGESKYFGDVTIPSTVSYGETDYTVVSISSFAFSKCEDLKSLNLPTTIQSIGEYAFDHCTSLKTIVMPDSVSFIGSWAFWDCTNLLTAKLSTSLKSVEDYTFYGCRNLKSIVVPDGVKRIGGNAFQDCRMLEEVTMSNSINAIGHFAFSGCSNIKSLTLPNQLTSLEKYVFSGCSKIMELTIPSSVITIEENAFMNCSGLTSVHIPNSVNYIGNWAFSMVKAIQSIVTEIENPFAIDNYVFERDVKKNAVLHVPYGLRSVYEKTSGWDFVNVEEEAPMHYTLVLWDKKGSKIVSYELNNKPIITFTPTNMIVTTKNLDIDYFDLTDFSKITYENDIESAIYNIVTNKSQLCFDGEYLHFPSLQSNNSIAIYSINGTLVFNKVITQTDEFVFPISYLSKGAYLIHVNGITYKILKK